MLDVIKPGAMLSMWFNSRANAELVKNVMEWEDAHPHAAVPYAPGIGAEGLQPVGQWEHLDGDEWCCSSCGEVITTKGGWEFPTDKYCRYCGTRMKGCKK